LHILKLNQFVRITFNFPFLVPSLSFLSTLYQIIEQQETMCGVELTDETVREFSQVAMAMMNLKSRINEVISEWVEPGKKESPSVTLHLLLNHNYILVR
jgi:hypothetical protein